MVIIYFKATWCSGCQGMKATIEQLQKEGYEIQIIDADKDKKLAKKYNIESVPTIIIIQDDKEVDRVVGKILADDLRKRLTKKVPDYRIW